MASKIFAVVGIVLFVSVCLAMPIVSDVSYTSLASENETQSSTIGKHYFSQEETELINSKIGVD